jgi:carbonic anhydrase/acetyltransferase-like protein (isoleucine patch superfamily)
VARLTLPRYSIHMRQSYKGSEPVVDGDAFVAETAVLVGDVHIGAASTVWFGAVLRGDVNSIVVGKRTSVQDGTVVHCDGDAPCVIGNDVTIGHNATVHGCTIGDGAVIGIGATILSHAVVGEGAVVGAGALVPEGREIPPNTVAMGVPAKPLREVTEEERKRFEENAAHYVQLGQEYRS